MKNLPHILLLLAFVGCSQSPKALPAVKVANQLEACFATAPAEMKAAMQSVATALKEKKYDVAYLALETLRGNRSLTEEQNAVIAECMHTVQMGLSQAIVDGDTNALRVVRMMNGAPQ